jgi:hypothetical protein
MSSSGRNKDVSNQHRVLPCTARRCLRRCIPKSPTQFTLPATFPTTPDPRLPERKLSNPMAGPKRPQAIAKTRRPRAKRYTCLHLLYHTDPVTKSRAQHLSRSQSPRICAPNFAKAGLARSVLLVSRPGKTIHASRRSQKEQTLRPHPVSFRSLVLPGKSGTEFSVRPLAPSSVCPDRRTAFLARRLAPLLPAEHRITSTA